MANPRVVRRTIVLSEFNDGTWNIESSEFEPDRGRTSKHFQYLDRDDVFNFVDELLNHPERP